MKIVRSGTKVFEEKFKEITGRGEADASAFEAPVRAIIDDVRKRGDHALVDYGLKFDGVRFKKTSDLVVKKSEIDAAVSSIPSRDLDILKLAAKRIAAFHERQTVSSWTYTEGDGTLLGQKVTPLEKVGIYVPGGKASYPSTVLMNAVPASVAGVGEICMATPPGRNGAIDPYVLAAARVAGVERVFRVGGAQAIAAFAYGTRTVPRVDKIVGPGNIYVATAKRLVFGAVDIDMIAGPSEILIIDDGSSDPRWLAADLLGQAEHDELAAAVLITTSERAAKAVSREVQSLLKKIKRKHIASASVAKYGAVIVVSSLEEAAGISNEIAPEHLELSVKEPLELLKLITNAGAVFLGHNTTEALGDYLAGPNHTLPTSGTARFSSPLGVYDFIKRTSVISFSKPDFLKLAPSVARFAEIEGLGAHGLSVTLRAGKKAARKRK
jgi:histidinol dehydrogenase